MPTYLEDFLTTLPCRGGESTLRALFEPIGYLEPNGHRMRLMGIEAEHPEHGCPTQMAIFEKAAGILQQEVSR